MAAIHDQLEAEGVQYWCDGALFTTARLGAGKLYITKQRVVFLRQNPLFSLLGAIGGLLAAKSEPKRVGLDIPLADVTGVEQGKFARAETLTIHYGDQQSAKVTVKTYATAVRAMGITDAAGQPAGGQ